MDEKEPDDKSVNYAEGKPRTLEIQFPLVDSQGKMLLPPAELCSAPVYANPRQALRILKRREMKRRLTLSGRLRVGRQEKSKFENEGKLKVNDGTGDESGISPNSTEIMT